MAGDTNTKMTQACEKIAEMMHAGPTYEWAIQYNLCQHPKDEFDPEEDDPTDVSNYEDAPSVYDWLRLAVYDTRFIVDEGRVFQSAQVMVAGGGPTIWVDFSTMTVIGTWWNDAPVSVPFIDGWDAESTLQSNWEQGA